jgi:CO/xanthine dehydrogenase FAD-binding subunit
MTSMSTVLAPSSSEEIGAAIAAEPGIVVVSGGTLVVPQHAVGGAASDRVMWLGRAGLDRVTEADGRITVGAMASLATCRELPSPIGPCASNIGDGEVQAQATLGGNISAPAPYGDLRGPLLALEADIHRVGPDGEETVDAAAGFAGPSGGSIVLEVSFEAPVAGSFVALQRHHTQALTAIGVSVVRTAGGELRLAATGMAPDARRLPSAEAVLAAGGGPDEAARAVVADIDPYDDALASAAYRSRVFPALVGRALSQLGG